MERDGNLSSGRKRLRLARPLDLSAPDPTTTGRTALALPRAVSANPAGWSPGALRVLAFGLVAFQLVQGAFSARTNADDPFIGSYYLITYRHGFVRSGLPGEVLRLLGAPTDAAAAKAASFAVAAAVVVALVLLIELLVRRGTPGAAATAVLIAASPFGVDYALVDRRPDLLALVWLVALGAVLVRRPAHPTRWVALSGAGFGALVLVHVDVALIELPWAAVLVAVATLGPGGRCSDRPAGEPAPRLATRLAVRLVALGALPAVAAVAVLTVGTPTAGTVAALRRDIAGPGYRGMTEFDFLRQNLSGAVHLVGTMAHSVQLDSLVVGGGLLVLQVAWVARWAGPGVWRPFLRRGNRALGALLAAGVAAAAVLLFATGIDWLRWCCDLGAAWLVVQACTALLLAPEGADRPGPSEPSRTALAGWLPAAAVYLAVVPPLAAVATGGPLHRFFFFV